MVKMGFPQGGEKPGKFPWIIFIWEGSNSLRLHHFTATGGCTSPLEALICRDFFTGPVLQQRLESVLF